MFKRFWWVFLAMMPAGAVVGVLLAAVVTYVMPKQYESEAVIEVRPTEVELLGYDPTDTVGTPSEDVSKTPVYLKTAVEVINSSASLGNVVEKLELINKWGVDKETAVQILKGIVSTENIRGTDLISIRVRHTDREGVRDIAAEVARVYRDYRKEIMNRDQERNLAELNKAVKEQEEKVEERRKVYATLMRNGGPHRSLQIHDEASDTPEETITRAQDKQDYIDVKRDFETDQALLQNLKLRLISETIIIKTPNESIVIHQEPQIPNRPISPNVTLNLVLGIALGFLISPLLALPLMWLLNRQNPVKEGRTTADPGWP